VSPHLLSRLVDGFRQAGRPGAFPDRPPCRQQPCHSSMTTSWAGSSISSAMTQYLLVFIFPSPHPTRRRTELGQAAHFL
jgi:hypothetical protein